MPHRRATPLPAGVDTMFLATGSEGALPARRAGAPRP
jgi:hypothetical protein